MSQSHIFPVEVRTDVYKYFIDNTLNCHWHGNFEFGILLAGVVDLYINNTYVKLRKGDGYFINSNILHTSRQGINNEKENAVMFVLTFPATVLTPDINNVIYEKYFAPLLNMRIEGFKISEANQTGKRIKETLMLIYNLEPSEYGYELECLKHLNQLWLATLCYTNENKGDLLHRTNDIKQIERMKNILSYIHANYNEKITADAIANHAGVSRGECFRCFKHFMNKTLVEYINEYRLQRVAALLRETEMSVIDISMKCGFENASYFGKVFKELYLITPNQYRKARIWTENTAQNISGYDYEYFKRDGNGKMIIITNANNGSFLCEWSNSSGIIFRSGKKFDRSKTHSQLGYISLQFDAVYNSDGNVGFSIYGWTVDPLAEFLIIEHYTGIVSMKNDCSLGAFNADGGDYQIYHNKKINQPTILGAGNFDQYVSVRTDRRLTGTVDVSKHFRNFEKLGLKMGRVAEISLSIDSFLSSGNAVIRTNILSIS
jgi:endo-1,4-beta-xylanase